MFDRRVISVSQPMPEFRIIDPQNWVLLGYTVEVEYEKHKKRRFFALKQGKKKVDNYMQHAEKTQRRALEYMVDMRDRIHNVNENSK